MGGHCEVKEEPGAAADAVADLSSSDGEDLAMLQEIKARMEARRRAKLLRQTEKSKEDGDTQEQRSGGNSSDSVTLPDKAIVRRTPSRIIIDTTQQPIKNELWSISPTLDSFGEQAARPSSEMVTPTRRTAAFISPGLRTPSPPSRTRSFMSPPSGASSRKRQHSPSPLPRKSSASAQRTRIGSITPSARRRLNFLPDESRSSDDGFLSPSAAAAERSAARIENADDDFQDLLGDEFDESILDALLDDDFDRLSPEPTTASTAKKIMDNDVDSHSTEVGTVAGAAKPASEDIRPLSMGLPKSGARDHSLTEKVEAQKQRRDAELAALSEPQATFITVASRSGPISAAESDRLGHASDFDPLTGLRIRDRVTSCEDVAKMTRDLRIVPIKDSDQIRDYATQCSSSGVLPSSTSVGRLTTSSSISSIKSADESNKGSWIIAGVVGAKSKRRVTAKKVRYCHFQLCDLKSGAINVFMFRTVMERHHERLKVGDVVAIMDPRVLNQAERAGTLGVEVAHPDCLIVIGTSSDFGLCEAVKLNGDNCGRLLDKRGSAYCSFHVMMATNKRRNQRGSLIAGTSSIFDLEKPQAQAGPGVGVPRKAGGFGLSRPHPEKMRMMAQSARETTYIFDDGGIGTSSLEDHNSPRKANQQPATNLSTFLMSQNNPGGQYLRQATTSKDVAWAKDVTSPKTPSKTNELFPAEMVRRMGYDPVAGHFVHGSPKRLNDDLEARERSIRLLMDRVKSPPGPMSPSRTLSPARQRTIDVNGTARQIAQPRPRAAKTNPTAELGGGRRVQGDVFFADQQGRERGDGATATTPAAAAAAAAATKKWVDLSGESSEGGSESEGSPLLSLSQQRAKNLLEGKHGRLGATTVASTARLLGSGARASLTPVLATKVLGFGPETAKHRGQSSQQQQQQQQRQSSASSSSSSVLEIHSSKLDVSRDRADLSDEKARATVAKIARPLPSPDDAPASADTQLQVAGGAASAPGRETDGSAASKKPKFIDFSDSE
ncbi:hypothetical protein BGZ99_008720 [Dissophora globulifera]|uniref:Zinc finger Mcm10/DnaG-type domain-containing protein n=1 Tax=Dissophora globulifera TaxID=979702 RepID=A0A9P6R6B7_9FUNG|nr:hypothetical protein BGZ99_008720 [Dissophora globulifera]